MKTMMEGMSIVGEKKDNDITSVSKTMEWECAKEVLENILTDNSKVPKHGSGVGVINVHSRIQLMFGEEYGLTVESEPDEGTKVVIPYSGNPIYTGKRRTLELQKYIQRRPGG